MMDYAGKNTDARATGQMTNFQLAATTILMGLYVLLTGVALVPTVSFVWMTIFFHPLLIFPALLCGWMALFLGWRCWLAGERIVRHVRSTRPPG